MIDFAQPVYFALGLFVLLIAAVSLYAGLWRRHARHAFAGPQSFHWGDQSFWLRSLLVVAAAALLTVAAARPQWGNTETFRENEGIDYVIALDVSQSMTAGDVEPSRLEVAQEQLVRLVQDDRGSRIGLVVFAGSAFLRSPLTSDTLAMGALIRRAADETSLARGGSDLGAALEVARTILAGAEPDRGRAVVVVSDGEDHAGSFATQAEAMANEGTVVLTAGIGTAEGALLFDETPDGRLVPKLDANGVPVVSRLVEGPLRQIAETTGGRYVAVSDSSRNLLSLEADLQALDSTPAGTEVSIVPIERFQPFVVAAIGLLLLAWFLPARIPLPRIRRHQPALASLLLALLIGACGGGGDEDEGSLRERNEEANALFAAGDFQGALDIYQQLLAERPDVDELSYNAGNALHRLEAFERAVTTTNRGLPPRDPVLGANAYYALGNHLLLLGRLPEAYNAYREALLLDPGDEGAKHNLELVLRLATMEEDQPPAAQQPQDGPNQDQPPGENTPGPSSSDDPSATAEGDDGSPEAGATQEPGSETDQPPGTPSGEPTDDAVSQRTLAEALAGIDDEVTFEEAIEILDLFRQQQAVPQPPAGGEGAGPDY